MPVTYVFEVMYLRFINERGQSQGSDGCISPTVDIDAAEAVEVVDEVLVLFRPPEGKCWDLEIVIKYRGFLPFFEESRIDISRFNKLFSGFPKPYYAFAIVHSTNFKAIDKAMVLKQK